MRMLLARWLHLALPGLALPRLDQTVGELPDEQDREHAADGALTRQRGRQRAG